MKVGFSQVSSRGINLLVFNNSQQKQNYSESTISFDIVAAPAPPNASRIPPLPSPPKDVAGPSAAPARATRGHRRQAAVRAAAGVPIGGSRSDPRKPAALPHGGRRNAGRGGGTGLSVERRDPVRRAEGARTETHVRGSPHRARAGCERCGRSLQPGSRCASNAALSLSRHETPERRRRSVRSVVTSPTGRRRGRSFSTRSGGLMRSAGRDISHATGCSSRPRSARGIAAALRTSSAASARC